MIEHIVGRVVPSRLAELEDVIDRGRATFVEVGHALMEIRDSRLYRKTHRTFEGYCRDRHGFSRQRAHQLIEAFEYVESLSTVVDKPKNEGEARRQMTDVKDTEEVAVTDKVPPNVIALVKAVEGLEVLMSKLSSKDAARRVRPRSRPAYARRLRAASSYLGRIALNIEEENL